jgi:hypothetical protein
MAKKPLTRVANRKARPVTMKAVWKHESVRMANRKKHAVQTATLTRVGRGVYLLIVILRWFSVDVQRAPRFMIYESLAFFAWR